MSARRPFATLKSQHGAALISAMLVVTLVATLASAALWQQWRQVEVESAERHRTQSAWLLNGAMDWTRLILREDALSANATTAGAGRSNEATDHLAEPWALPLQEAKLSSFLAQDKQLREGDPEVFLSGQVVDAQSRLNLANWVEQGKLSQPMQLSLTRLFNLLGLPPEELQVMGQEWLAAWSQSSPEAALLPQNVAQLQWLGLSAQSAERLSPFVTVLSEASPVNLNTASVEVIYASVQGLDMASAKQFVELRTRTHFENLGDAGRALGGRNLEPRWHSVGSRFFEVWGRLRMEERSQEEKALMLRNGSQVSFVWRRKNAQLFGKTAPDSLQSPQP
ncbi:MAG: general secretion pathway protein GspK [Betaproteobacteria bacterium]|jgi:general secretion pathway protein K|nr:type II secretion system minor pseudopilin GspK [Burkholderiales bacterium]NBX89552.1 general secretion pathway protein GspK [Betaproteobacteria bacterium]